MFRLAQRLLEVETELNSHAYAKLDYFISAGLICLRIGNSFSLDNRGSGC
jgi:hypothetical protein